MTYYVGARFKIMAIANFLAPFKTARRQVECIRVMLACLQDSDEFLGVLTAAERNGKTAVIREFSARIERAAAKANDSKSCQFRERA